MQKEAERPMPRHDDEQPGCMDVLMALFRACGLCCYVACPPVPSLITRKLAFHPPRKGVTYRIELKNEPERKIKNISQVKDKEYQMVIQNIATNMGYIPSETDLQVFSVTTAHNNELVCVRCPPYEPPTHPQLVDQVILFCQPNSSDLGGFLQPMMMNFGNYANIFEMDIFAFDYSGYGYSSGSPGEKNLYADVRAVYSYIRETYPTKRIVLMGYSIGTTAVVDLASTNPDGLAGVILIAPFTSGLRLVSSKPNQSDTCWADSFRSYDKIGNIETKVLICHGDLDEVIPMSHGMALFEKLRNPVAPSVIHGANHQTILSGRHAQTFSRICRFLKFETEVANRSAEVVTSKSKSNSKSKSTTNSK